MKPFVALREPVERKDFVGGLKPTTPGAKEITEMQPTFTLTFAVGTSMKEIHDTVIQTLLQYTRNNRLRAAQLLHINPRTIRRRLGKKEFTAATTRAA